MTNKCEYCSKDHKDMNVENKNRHINSFGYPFSLGSALKSSKRTPCTNRPIRCKICKCVFWSYSILIHYAFQHSHLTCEEICFPTQEEISAVKASKF